MKRFKKCNEWIKWFNEHMIQEKIAIYDVPEKLKTKNVIAIDASNITSKGAVKQTWRLHYAVNLFSMTTEQFKITPEHKGESLKNYELHENDLILADSIYATITGIEYCCNAGADYILRIRNKAFKLYDKDGHEVVLYELLKDIADTCCDFHLYYMDSEKELNPIRFCAVQKTEEEKALEQKKLKRVEMVFKRFKSILNLGSMPTKTAASSEV